MADDEMNIPNEDAGRLRRLRERTAAYIAEREETTGRDAPPEFLAAPLRRRQEAEGLSRAAFAQSLSGDEEALDRLSLCRSPRPERFAEDAAALADYCRLDPARLLSLLRKMQVMTAFSAAGELSPATSAPNAPRRTGFAGAEGLLLAARDRDEEDADSTDPDENAHDTQDAPNDRDENDRDE